MTKPEVLVKHDTEDWRDAHVNCYYLYKVSKLVDWEDQSLDKY
ncbi:hypothetical protein [Paraglaciecola sp. 20A4]|nr:hypothetical protein [Paraglaciecola sp. 20A4]